jgi:hypothetical protein
MNRDFLAARVGVWNRDSAPDTCGMDDRNPAVIKHTPQRAFTRQAQLTGYEGRGTGAGGGRAAGRMVS